MPAAMGAPLPSASVFTPILGRAGPVAVLAPNIDVLIVARVGQGVGGAHGAGAARRPYAGTAVRGRELSLVEVEAVTPGPRNWRGRCASMSR